METDLRAVLESVDGATLPEDTRRTAVWCIHQLPRLYQQLFQTFDSRDAAEIQWLVDTTLNALNKIKPHGPELAKSVATRLVSMHERVGLPSLKLKAPKAPRSRKAG